MHSDIIEVCIDNAPRDGLARPGLLAPGYYLALPRRHKKKQHDGLHIAPTLVGPVSCETAARLLKVSSAYLGLDQAATDRHAEQGREHGHARYAPHHRGEAVVQARVV